MTNVIRFPIERRRDATPNAECCIAAKALGVTFVGDKGLDTCPSWGHIWAMGAPRCLCGEGSRDSQGRPA